MERVHARLIDEHFARHLSDAEGREVARVMDRVRAARRADQR
jgi:hypothetical protein